MSETIRAEGAARLVPRNFVLRNTLIAVLYEAAAIWGYVFSETAGAAARQSSSEHLYLFLKVAVIVAAIAALPRFLKAVRLGVFHSSLERSMRQVALTVLNGLCRCGIIASNPASFNISVDKGGAGEVFLSIDGGSQFEQKIMVEAVGDIFSQVSDQRYLLERKSFFGFWQRKDYEPVPDCVAQKKKHVEIFAKEWESRIGAVRIVYTRCAEGRKTLLKARYASFAAAFNKKTEILQRWR